MAQSSAWRGRESDITGLYNIGLRPYDPVSGRWLTFDPTWNEGDPDGYTFCAGGDPVNYFDPDGRFGKQAFENANVNPYANELKTTATVLDAYSATTDSSIGGGTAEFLSHFVHMGVNNGSPSVFLNQAVADYQAGGVLNAANRYNPVVAPFQAVSGLNIMQGEGFGERLNSVDRSVAWLNTVALVSGTAAGALRPTPVTVATAPPILPAVVTEAASVQRVGAMYPRNALFSPLAGDWEGTLTKQTDPILQTQKELSQLVNRQANVVDRWLAASDNRWAQLYRSVQNVNPNFAAGIRGRILDVRMRSQFRDLYGDVPGIRIDQTIPGSGNGLRPDLYFPNLGGKSVIFDVGGTSKLGEIGKYQGMADILIPIVPEQWIR